MMQHLATQGSNRYLIADGTGPDLGATYAEAVLVDAGSGRNIRVLLHATLARGYWNEPVTKLTEKEMAEFLALPVEVHATVLRARKGK